MSVRGSMDLALNPAPGVSLVPGQLPALPPPSGFFVSPTGSSSNPGTMASPWSLAFAKTGANGAIHPGDTIWLRGGNYGSVGGITSITVAGASGNPIKWRNFPGEIVAHDGKWQHDAPYNRLWGVGLGFILYNSNPSANDIDTFKSFSTQPECINVILHDSSNQGILLPGEPSGQFGGFMYGDIVYNGGRFTNNDHGVYVFGGPTLPVTLKEIISFQNWSQGFQGEGTNDGLLEHDGCVAFMGGEISGVPDRDFYDNRGPNSDARYRSCYGFSPPGEGLSNVEKLKFGWDAAPGTGRLDILDCRFYGGLRMNRRSTANTHVRRNKFYAMQLFWWEIHTNPTAPPDWDENEYWERIPGWDNQGKIRVAGVDFATFADLAAWKVQHAAVTSPSTTPDVNGSFAQTAAGDPQTGTFVDVRPNAFEAGRGHIVIYNFGLASTVDVNLSSILSVGDNYEIRNVQKLFTTPTSHILAPPVLSGTYNGGTVAVPMGGIVPLDPIDKVARGCPASPRASGPKFGAFIVQRITGTPQAAFLEPAPQLWGIGEMADFGAATVWPPHRVGDRGYLLVETANEVVPTPGGWTLPANSPQGTGAVGGLAATRLTVFERVAASSAEADVVLANPGDHIMSRIVTVRGSSGIEVTAGDVQAGAVAAVSIPGAVTTVPNCLVLLLVSQGIDSSNADHMAAGLWANVDLENVSRWNFPNSAQGNGGGVTLGYGIKRAAGAYGATTTTLATPFQQGRMSIALKP